MMRGLVLTCALWACNANAWAQDTAFANLMEHCPGIRIDLRYATANNFTGTVVYDTVLCLVRQPVADRLCEVQHWLEKQGLGIKVFDGYRPLSAQWKFWALVPDERYVADPRKGSRHNRGTAVDLTLVDKDGRELEMPTAYDDFSEKAHQNATEGISPLAQANRKLLRDAMTMHGFSVFETEWWHYDFVGWQNFNLSDMPLRAVKH